MRHIKFRDGYTPIGRQTAEYLQASDLAHVTKRSIDSLSRRNGDYTNVYKTDVKVASVYVLGINTLGQWQVRGAGNAAGTFKYVGAPETERTGVPNTAQPNFFHYGKKMGFSAVLYGADTPSIDDFAGQPWLRAKYIVTNSRNGVQANSVDYFQVDVITPNFIILTVNYAITHIESGYRMVGVTPTFYSGFYLTRMAVDQPAHAFIVDDGNNISFGATLGYSNAIAFFAQANTLAPGVIIKMDVYLRATGYTVVPLLVLVMSFDAGASWLACPTPTLISTEQATIDALGTSPGDYLNFRDAAASVRLDTAPLSRLQSVAVAVIPYMAGGVLKARVKMGVADAGTGSVSGSTVLLDAVTRFAAYDHFKSLLALKSGVLVITRDPTNPWTQPARIRKTVDGVALVDVGYLPLPDERMGQVTALSPTLLVCPGYDESTYFLYQSKDGGATWSRRSIISTDGAAPAGGERMTNFYIAVMPRYAGNSANSTPATPWLTDIRIDPP